MVHKINRTFKLDDVHLWLAKKKIRIEICTQFGTRISWTCHGSKMRRGKPLILVWNLFLEPFLPRENPSLFLKLGFWYSIFVSILLSYHRDLIWRSMPYASSMSWNMYKQNLIFWQNICFVHGLRKLNYNFRWRGEQRVC